MDGIAVFIALFILFLWAGPVWRKRIVGFGGATDIGVHIILQTLLGGAADGRMAMLFGGVLFNVFLLVYRKTRGYTSFTDGEWVTHSGWFYRATKSGSAGSSGTAGSVPAK